MTVLSFAEISAKVKLRCEIQKTRGLKPPVGFTVRPTASAAGTITAGTFDVQGGRFGVWLNDVDFDATGKVEENNEQRFICFAERINVPINSSDTAKLGDNLFFDWENEQFTTARTNSGIAAYALEDQVTGADTIDVCLQGDAYQFHKLDAEVAIRTDRGLADCELIELPIGTAIGAASAGTQAAGSVITVGDICGILVKDTGRAANGTSTAVAHLIVACPYIIVAANADDDTALGKAVYYNGTAFTKTGTNLSFIGTCIKATTDDLLHINFKANNAIGDYNASA